MEDIGSYDGGFEQSAREFPSSQNAGGEEARLAKEHLDSDIERSAHGALLRLH